VSKSDVNKATDTRLKFGEPREMAAMSGRGTDGRGSA